ncbi:MAG: response regulator transcription factor [Bacteroidota bacterium]
MTQIKILLADDHKIVRDGIISLLSDEENLNIVCEAENGIQVIDKLKNHDIDIIIMDISMPKMNGIECTINVKRLYPHIHVLILSMYNEEQYVSEVFSSGASGYILKSSGRDDLINAIVTINAGKPYYSPEITQTYIESLAKPTNVSKSGIQDVIDELTSREFEVLELIVNEHSNLEIAEKLFISVRTVDAHRRNLINKIDVKNTAGLVKFAISNNLFDED